MEQHFSDELLRRLKKAIKLESVIPNQLVSVLGPLTFGL
jgi:hypothetical protein